MERSAAWPARGVALDPPCSYRLRSVGTASAAPHVGLWQIPGLLVTPEGTRQTGWPAREVAPCRQSRCTPGRSAARFRTAPGRTDDAARPARSRPVRKTPCSPTPSLPGIQSGRRRTDRVAPQRSTARARKPWRRAVVTALFRDSLHSRYAHRFGRKRQRDTAGCVGAVGFTPFRSPCIAADTLAL